MSDAEGSEPWKQEVKAIIREELKPLQQSLQQLHQSHPSSGQEGTDVPIYKCKGKDCGFATDDISDFIAHTVKENIPKSAELPEPGEPVKKRHATVDEFLNCPDCFPKFEKAMLARGYRPPEKAAEKKAGERAKELPL